MKTRYTLLTGVSVLAFAMGGLGMSGVASAQATAVHAKTAQAPAARQPDRPATTVRPIRIRPFYAGPIQTADGNVLEASGCGIPANIIEYYYTGSACEYWYANLQYYWTPIYASYGGHTMCMNVSNNNFRSGTQIIAWGCDNHVYPNNELFHIAELGSGGQYWIEPDGGSNLCFNVAGGVDPGRNIILYSCVASQDEYFRFPG